MFNKLLPRFGKKVIMVKGFHITECCGINKNRIMDNYKTVDDLLRLMNLTAEELETHKELIEECRENERKIVTDWEDVSEEPGIIVVPV